MLLSTHGIVVSIELSVEFKLHIRENERGRRVSDFSTVHAILFFQFYGKQLIES